MFELVCQIASIACMIALMALIVLISRKHRIEKDNLEDSLRSKERENENLEHLNRFLKRENEKLSQKINGGRYPDKSCVGCKHLITQSIPASTAFTHAEKIYLCRKNIRCNEYEE